MAGRDITQYDLFEAREGPVRQRGGIPRHVPSADSRLLANTMKAAGETQEAIARALGIGTSTLATHYFPSRSACPPRGRRRHIPTRATRKAVIRALRMGMRQTDVARLIGVSEPTLRKHYRKELASERLAEAAP